MCGTLNTLTGRSSSLLSAVSSSTSTPSELPVCTLVLYMYITGRKRGESERKREGTREGERKREGMREGERERKREETGRKRESEGGREREGKKVKWLITQSKCSCYGLTFALQMFLQYKL